MPSPERVAPVGKNQEFALGIRRGLIGARVFASWGGHGLARCLEATGWAMWWCVDDFASYAYFCPAATGSTTPTRHRQTRPPRFITELTRFEALSTLDEGGSHDLFIDHG